MKTINVQAAKAEFLVMTSEITTRNYRFEKTIGSVFPTVMTVGPANSSCPAMGKSGEQMYERNHHTRAGVSVFRYKYLGRYGIIM